MYYITGINGFVGNNFTNSWGKSHELFGLDISQPDKVEIKRALGIERMPVSTREGMKRTLGSFKIYI